MPVHPPTPDRVRLDKWLWAARFFKTRGLATEAIGKGHVLVNDQPAKASREVRVGDRVAFRQGTAARTVVVRLASDHRGPATFAQTLFEETPESVALRERLALERRLNAEPALAIEQGRPTKRNRRELADWQRWSASVDPD